MYVGFGIKQISELTFQNYTRMKFVLGSVYGEWRDYWYQDAMMATRGHSLHSIEDGELSKRYLTSYIWSSRQKAAWC